jgi:DNA-binding NarL/FixJ family response regulator
VNGDEIPIELVGTAARLGQQGRRPGGPDWASLSAREEEVLLAMMSGLPAAAIASAYGTTLPTVRTHIQAILRKLGTHSQIAATSLAFQHGWRPTWAGASRSGVGRDQPPAAVTSDGAD